MLISSGVDVIFEFLLTLELLVIGVVLIYSVTVMIRNVSAHSDGAKADLKAIVIHAGAFGLFLLTTIIFGSILLLNLFGLISATT